MLYVGTHSVLARTFTFGASGAPRKSRLASTRTGMSRGYHGKRRPESSARDERSWLRPTWSPIDLF